MIPKGRYKIGSDLLGRLKEVSHKCRTLVETGGEPIYLEQFDKNIYHLSSRNYGLVITEKDPEFSFITSILELTNI